jgi:LysR family hydrogen peroxide-inducible transcriptional activator
MELQQLRYLVEVAKTRSFTRAAKECHVTQPTLSHQIMKLEEEIGEPIFERRKKGAFLTPLGERLFEHARSILGTVEIVRQEASAFSKTIQGRLRIGIIPTVAPYFLPRLLTACQKKHPGISFQVTEEPTENLLSDLRRGTMDVAVLSPPLVGGDVKFKDLFDDEFLLVVPRRHPLTRAKTINLADIQTFPMILMNDAHCIRGQTLSLCKRAGFTPQVFIQSAQLDTVLAMVEAGMGISLVPESARKSFRHRKVVFRSLRPEMLTRRISLAWPKQSAPTRALEALLDLAGTL